MSKNINLKSINLRSAAKIFSQKFGRHAVFATVLIILLAYLLIVFKISSLSTAEPSPEQETTVQTLIPKIDPKAVSQIQSLENNNTEIHSLFEAARNNPFQE